MLDYLRSFFKKDTQLANMSFITGHLSDIIMTLESEYMKDRDAKNAAIDTIIKLLEEHKDVPVSSANQAVTNQAQQVQK